MPSQDASEGLAGLLQWSEPIIVDRLYEAYRVHIREFMLARSLARLHAKVWRALIRGDMAQFEAMREGLVVALGHCSLTLDDLAATDNAIMAELLDVVMARFQRSQRTAKVYHLALIELAVRRAASRAAA